MRLGTIFRVCNTIFVSVCMGAMLSIYTLINIFLVNTFLIKVGVNIPSIMMLPYWAKYLAFFGLAALLSVFIAKKIFSSKRWQLRKKIGG